MTREEIKSQNTMRDVLFKVGADMPNRAGFIKCPFHQGDNTASMKIYKDSYHCYGCGANGDIFTFVQNYNGFSFKDAFVFLGGNYEHTVENTLAIARAKYERQKREELELKKRKEKKENARLIWLYRSMMKLSKPFDEIWIEAYNKLQFQLYKWEARYGRGEN